MRRDDLIAVADSIHTHTKAAVAPVHERLAGIERSIDARVAVVARDMELMLTRELGSIRERVVALETRPPVPGPEGPPGPAGQDGRDGKDGTSVEYTGPYSESKAYQRGQLVTHGGSGWHCNVDGTTRIRPGDGSPAWTLMIKRGQDGKGSH